MNRRAFLAALGTTATAVMVNGISLDALPAIEDVFRVGDVITIAGRFAVNPLTRQATSCLQSFVVTEVCAAGIRLSPPLDNEIPWSQARPLVSHVR